MKEKVYEFDFGGIYPRPFWVVVSNADKIDGFEDLPKVAETALASEMRINYKGNGGFLVRFYKKANMTPWCIAHEALHLSCDVFQSIGAYPITEDMQEPLAYLHGYIVECIYKVKEGKAKPLE